MSATSQCFIYIIQMMSGMYPGASPYNPSAVPGAGAHMYPPAAGVMLPPHLQQQQPQYYPQQSPYPGAYPGAYPGPYPGAYTQPHHMTRPASPYGK